MRYSVTGEPPSEAGAVHDSATLSMPASARSSVGASGAAAGASSVRTPSSGSQPASKPVAAPATTPATRRAASTPSALSPRPLTSPNVGDGSPLVNPARDWYGRARRSPRQAVAAFPAGHRTAADRQS